VKKVFDFEDYRSFLKARIRENRDIKAYRTKLAMAAGCQRSFFSQVLNSHVEFTMDHGAGLCEFFGFDQEETEYFLCLIQLSRAATERLKRILRAKLEEIQSAQDNFGTRLKVKEVPNVQHEIQYFSSWFWSAIHAAVDSSKFQTPEVLASRLGLPLSIVKKALDQLAEMKLVHQVGQKWKMGERFIHLNLESVMTEVNHLNWRQRALLDIQQRKPTSIHYTSVFTMKPSDFKTLKSSLMAFVDESRSAISQSPAEELYSFTCDLFEV
jgi:uncharacterized protein (TIGR02147 family)